MTVVAIDGLAGGGKSTVARRLAARLEIAHVDTGAYYRALTLAVLRAGVDPADAAGCVEVLRRIHIARKGGRTLLSGEDVEAEIRGPAVTAAVSAVSGHPVVRKQLVELQRAAVGPAGAVVEGRDAATVIVPDATLKVWLSAVPSVRAERRARDLGETGPQTLDRVSADLAARDHADRHQSRRAADAITVETTHRDVDSVVDAIVDLLRQRTGPSG